MGEFSIWHWFLVLLIVILLFGTKKLRNVGSDLGTAMRQFKKSLNEGDDKPADGPTLQHAEPHPGAQAPRETEAAGQKLDV